MDRAHFEDDATRGGFDQIPHRDDNDIDDLILLRENLFDELVQPGGLDHVWQLFRRRDDRHGLVPGLGVRVPLSEAGTVDFGFQSERREVANQKARSRAARARDDHVMPHRL